MYCLHERVKFGDSNCGFGTKSSLVIVYACRYLCEVMGTSQPNLLMEEAALIAMMESQAEIR